MVEKVGTNLLKNKVLLLIISCIFLGILLVVLGNNSKETEVISPQTQEEREEQRIKAMIESINGVKNVTVLVTFDSDDTVSAANFGSSGKNTNDSNSIKGIAVSADGADNPLICEKIISLLCAAYDITDSMVFVCGK